MLFCRVRRLIVNADDFGLTPGVNRGILEGHVDGIVTSSTLMATGMAFDDAAALSRSVPRLSGGCHVALIDGLPVLSSHELPTLANHSGQFDGSLGPFVARVVCGKINSREIEAEATAQIRKLQSAGVAVSHIDTHKHTHLFPVILTSLLQAAKACDIRAMRNPFGRIAFSLVARRPSLWKRYGQMGLLNTLAARFKRTVHEAGLITTDGSLGVVATGAIDERLFTLILDNLPDGTWELVTHPGYNDSDLEKVPTRLRESREQELKILTAQSTRELLERNGIQLISYRDLA